MSDDRHRFEIRFARPHGDNVYWGDTDQSRDGTWRAKWFQDREVRITTGHATRVGAILEARSVARRLAGIR